MERICIVLFLVLIFLICQNSGGGGGGGDEGGGLLNNKHNLREAATAAEGQRKRDSRKWLGADGYLCARLSIYLPTIWMEGWMDVENSFRIHPRCTSV